MEVDDRLWPPLQGTVPRERSSGRKYPFRWGSNFRNKKMK